MKKSAVVRTVSLLLVLFFVVQACAPASAPATPAPPTSVSAAKPAPTIASAAAPAAQPTSAPAAAPASRAKQTIELSYASYQPPTHPHASTEKLYLDKIAERVDKETNYSLKVTYHWQSSLLNDQDMLKGVGSGVADMGIITIPYFRKQLPLNGVGSLIFVTNYGDAALYGLLDVLKAFPEANAEWEKSGVKLLHPTYGTSMIFAFKKKINGLDDLRGLKIRTGGEEAKALAAIGAVPVAVGGGETYEAVQKGVVDGIAFALSGLISRKMYEVVTYVVDFDIGVYTMSASGVMNASTWKKLPAEIQNIINTTDFVATTVHEAIRTDAELLAETKKRLQLSVPPDNELKRAAELMGKPVWEEWIKAREAEGLPGRKVFDFYYQAAKKHESTSKLLKGGGLGVR